MPVQSSGPSLAFSGVTKLYPGGTVAVDFTNEPLWAYGFETHPAPGEKAAPQAPPTRNLRPNEDAAEQTRLRQERWRCGRFGVRFIGHGFSSAISRPTSPSMQELLRS